MSHKQVLFAPPRLMRFFSFTSASSMSLYVSTLHVFYPSWEPHTSSLSSNIGNNTPLFGLFQDRLCGLMGFLVAIYRPCSNCERDPPCSIYKRASSTHTSFSLQLWNEPRWLCQIFPTPSWVLIPFVGGDKHLGETPWVINITYRDTLTKRPKPRWVYIQLCYINYSFFSSLFNVELYSHV